MTDWTPWDRSASQPEAAATPLSLPMPQEVPLGMGALDSADSLLSTITEAAAPATVAPWTTEPGVSWAKAAELAAYYAASWPYRWWFRRRAAAAGELPMVVFMYHRIADNRLTPWTTTTRTFASRVSIGSSPVARAKCAR